MATVALEAQRDSSSMKTIAVVTMIYLPGAFVAAIFGMSIIDFSVDEVSGARRTVVGDHWRTFLAVTISMTALTLGTWYAWNRLMITNLSRTLGLTSKAEKGKQTFFFFFFFGNGRIEAIMAMDFLHS
jgi:hypothetical protein